MNVFHPQTFHYSIEQFLPTPIDNAWQFFSTPKNLALITPSYLDFKILTTISYNEIYEGMLIDYTVKPLFKIPLHWQTEICKIKKPVLFTDRQLKGPFHLWEHTHMFISKDGGVMMKDEVQYQLPFGFIGYFIHPLFIRKKIENIFSYRAQVLKKIFGR